jgi:hypothetical protein
MAQRKKRKRKKGKRKKKKRKSKRGRSEQDEECQHTQSRQMKQGSVLRISMWEKNFLKLSSETEKYF